MATMLHSHRWPNWPSPTCTSRPIAMARQLSFCNSSSRNQPALCPPTQPSCSWRRFTKRPIPLKPIESTPSSRVPNLLPARSRRKSYSRSSESSTTSVRLRHSGCCSRLLYGVGLKFFILVEVNVDVGPEARDQESPRLQMQRDRRRQPCLVTNQRLI